jgi:hypothetical protein
MLAKKPDVYILNIANVEAAWIANPTKVTKKLEQLFSKTGFSVIQVTTFSQLDELVKNGPEHILFVNTYGEAIPIPDGWDDWAPYLQKIGSNVRDKSWTVVSMTGYPFYYTVKLGSSPVPIVAREQTNGLGAFISVCQGQVQGPVTVETSVTLVGTTALSRTGEFAMPKSLWASRCFYWEPKESIELIRAFYAAGRLEAAAAVKMGKGMFLYNGMMAPDFGSNVSEYSDDLLTRLTFAFSLDSTTESSLEEWVGHPAQFLDSLEHDLSTSLSKMVKKGKKKVTEKDVQKHIESILDLKYRDHRFRKEQNRFPYSLKAYEPDFVSDLLNTAIEVKKCSSESSAKGIVGQINDDIVAYRTKYPNLLFVVYDLDKFIADKIGFTQDFERFNPGVRVIVV